MRSFIKTDLCDKLGAFKSTVSDFYSKNTDLRILLSG
jgi:hypothetical protein